jgi:hypothetical protein
MCGAKEGMGVALAGAKVTATSKVVEEKKCDLLPEVERGGGGKRGTGNAVANMSL